MPNKEDVTSPFQANPTPAAIKIYLEVEGPASEDEARGMENVSPSGSDSEDSAVSIGSMVLLTFSTILCCDVPR